MSDPGPSLPGGPAWPLAARSRSRCRPSPSAAPTLPPRGPRARSPRAPARELAPSLFRSPSRAAPPLLPRPLQRPRFSHTASGPALTLPHSHTQRDHGSWAAHILCVTRMLRTVRARNVGARLPSGEGEERRNIKALLGNEVPRLRAGMVGLDLPVSTTSAH